MTGHLFVLAAVRNSATPPPTPTQTFSTGFSTGCGYLVDKV